MRRSGKAVGTLAAATSLALASGGLAFADNLQDNLTTTAQQTQTIANGGSVTVNYYVGANGPEGCNVDVANPGTMALNLPSGVTADKTSLSFTACSNGSVTQSVTYRSWTAGSYAMAPTISGGKSNNNGWNNNNAHFTLVVEAPLDPCATVGNPAAPVFSAAAAGTSGWHTSVPSAAATSITDSATISYATDGTMFGALPTLPQGVTDVTAKASQPSPCEAKSSTASREFKVDTVAPDVNPGSVEDETWRNTPLSQDFSASDVAPGSGLADTADARFTLTASADSTRNATTGTVTPTSGGSKTVSDVAGNETTRTLSALIDTADPVAGVTGGPQDGQTYFTGSVPTASSANCSDDLSGLATTGGCVIGTGYSTGVGQHSFTVTATDKAGNDDSRTIAYTVKERTSAGYTSPVRLGVDVVNRVKGGSTVPLKFQVFESDGTTSVELTDTALLQFSVVKYTCDTTDAGVAVEEVTTGSTSLRYDAAGPHFMQNWKTPTTTGCYRANIAIANGQTITAQFQVTK